MLHLRKANPTLVFLLIAFGVPWSVQLFMALKRIPLIPLWPGLIVANSFCSVGGFVAAYCESGWAGATELGHRCVRAGNFANRLHIGCNCNLQKATLLGPSFSSSPTTPSGGRQLTKHPDYAQNPTMSVTA
jgi:hypothetical protein